MTREKQDTEHCGAHSQVHHGTSDYGDGANIEYQLGNDDYIRDGKDYSRNFLEDAFSVGKGNPEEDIGKIAYGNKVTEEDEDEAENAPDQSAG